MKFNEDNVALLTYRKSEHKNYMRLDDVESFDREDDIYVINYKDGTMIIPVDSLLYFRLEYKKPKHE